LAAVKVLHPKWTENAEVASRMRDEARLLGMLRHKHIVDVLDLTQIDGRAAVVMEFLEAVDLKVLVSAHRKLDRLVPLRAVLELFAGVASALDAAYNRPPYQDEKPLHVIHRDIKPSNIMVDGEGLAKVLDFGVARAEFDTREARTAELSFGSVEYMAPERLFFEPDTPASDVYSLGATMYELLALEKLGKCKTSAGAHEKWFSERFEDLLERHPMQSEEVEDMLHDLLFDMLMFDHMGRVSAADCVTRMRGMARKVEDLGLEEWSVEWVPALLAKLQARPPSRKDGESTSLINRVLTEDTSGLPAAPPADTQEATPEPGSGSTVDAGDKQSALHAKLLEAPDALAAPGPGNFDRDMHDDETSLHAVEQGDPGGDPDRWDALKQATLAGLAGEGIKPADSEWSPEPDSEFERGLTPPPVPEGVRSVPVHTAPHPLPGAALAPFPVAAPPARPSASSRPALPGVETPLLRPERAELADLLPSRLKDEDTHTAALDDFEDDAPTVVGDASTIAALVAESQPAAGAGESTVPSPAAGDSDGMPVDAHEEAPRTAFSTMVLVATLFVLGGGVGVLAAVGGAAFFILEPDLSGWVPAEDVASGLVEVVDAAPADPPVDAPDQTATDAPSDDATEGDGTADAEPDPDPGGDDGEGPAAADDGGEAGQVQFDSALDDTKKIQVRCEGGSASGTSSVTLEFDPGAQCTVTVLTHARKRFSRVVTPVEHRVYRCFEGGSSGCE
jgi:serine/threonine protein kinase